MDVIGFDLAEIQEIKMFDKCFCHSCCEIKAKIENSNVEKFLNHMKKISNNIYVSHKGEIVFCGRITEIQCQKTYLYTSVQVKAYSYSVELDSDMKKRAYQDPGNTYKDLADHLSNEKCEIVIDEDSFADRKTGMLLVQNQETDYEFLKRVVKEQGYFLYLDAAKKEKCKIIVGKRRNLSPDSIKSDEIKKYSYKYCNGYQEATIITDRFFEVGSTIEVFDTTYMVFDRTIINRYDNIEIEYHLTNEEIKIDKGKNNVVYSLGLAKVINNFSEEHMGKIQVDFEEYDNELSENRIWIDYISPLTEKGGGLVFVPDAGEYVDTLYKNDQCVAIGCIRRTRLDTKIQDVRTRSLLTGNCRVAVSDKDLNINVFKNKIQVSKDCINICSGQFETIMDEKKCRIGFNKGYLMIEDDSVQIFSRSKIDVQTKNINVKADDAVKIKTTSFDVG